MLDVGDGENIKKYTLAANSNGTASVTFTLGNHDDELRYSDVDVKYVVTVTDEDGKDVNGVEITYKDEKNNTPTEQKISTTNEMVDHNVTISGLKEGKTYTVTAVGYSGTDSKANLGYNKTIKAKFIIGNDKLAVYKHLATSDKANDQNDGCYVLLTVWSNGYGGNVDIDFSQISDKVIPDKTDSVMRDSITGNTVNDGKSFKVRTDDTKTNDINEADLNYYNSHTYRFFLNNGVDADSIELDNFIVTYGDKVAVEGDISTGLKKYTGTSDTDNTNTGTENTSNENGAEYTN
jgi:hypothetical protein